MCVFSYKFAEYFQDILYRTFMVGLMKTQKQIAIAYPEIPFISCIFHVETSQQICFANQVTVFCMIQVFVKGNSEQTIVQIPKQCPRGVLKKRCPENMEQIYRITPMQQCDFKKVAKQLNHFAVWLLSYKSAAYLQNTFAQELLQIQEQITSADSEAVSQSCSAKRRTPMQKRYSIDIAKQFY